MSEEFFPRGIPDNVRAHFRFVIDDYLKSSGLTHNDFADAMHQAGDGVSPALVSHWRTGRKFPSTGKLKTIAKATGKTVSELIGQSVRPHTVTVPVLFEISSRKSDTLAVVLDEDGDLDARSEIKLSWPMHYEMVHHKSGTLFAALIKESPNDARYQKGDYLFFEASDTEPRKDSAVIIKNKDEYHLKIFVRTKTTSYLASPLKDIPPIPISKGDKIVGCMRGIFSARAL